LEEEGLNRSFRSHLSRHKYPIGHSHNNTMNLENLPKCRATIETMKTQEFIDALKNVDVILTFPTSPEWNPQIAYGTKTLERIVKDNALCVLNMLGLVIDWTTNEPETLIALLRHIKGECDL
jgi:hypothetical protein